MKVTVSGAVRHLCPYRDEVDDGTAEITLSVTGGEDAPELHSIADTLADYAAVRISHEELTRAFYRLFHADKVVTRWKTAGLDVVVEVP